MEKSKRETGGIEKFIEEAMDSRLNQIIEALSEKIDELEAKAAAYDRIMSGGKKTLKELANFLGKPITVDKSGAIFAHEFVPHTSFGDMWVSNLFDCMAIHPNLIDYTGDWKDSLTLPDE